MTSAYDNLKNHINGCNGDLYLEVYNISIGNTSLNNSIKFDGSKIRDSSFFILIYSLVFFFGVFGNILVIVTLRSSPHLRTVTNCFLLSLAVSDLLQAVICIPISTVGQLLERFIFGEVMCKISYYVMGISVSVSTYTMLAISLERYYAICKPLKSRGWQTKSHAYKVIGFIWVLSLMFMFPYFIYGKIVFLPLFKYQECRQACRLQFEQYFIKKTWYVFMLLFLFLSPGVVMTISYVKVCRQIYQGFNFHTINSPQAMTTVGEGYNTQNSTSNKLIPARLNVSKDRTSSIHQSGSQLNSKKRIVRMLIVVVIFFFICWAPLFIVNLWKGFDEKNAFKTVGNFIKVIQFLSYVSTCTNPFIYCFMNLKFRQSFIKTFTCCIPNKIIKWIEDKPKPVVVDRTLASEICPTPVLPRNRNLLIFTKSSDNLESNQESGF